MEARVAVIVPCKDDGDLCAQAVESIEEREPLEVVVIDDGSSDARTLQVLEQLRAGGVRVVRHERNKGLIEARMTGLRETTATYVFPLDSDDLAVAGALGVLADRLDATPEADVCFGDYAEFGTQSAVRVVPERLDPYRVAYTNEYPVSALFRRSVLEQVGAWAAGGFPYAAYADWNLWMTLAERGTVALHAGPDLLTFRKRFQAGRMLDESRARHREMYADMRRRHPGLFGEIREHRRRSDMPAVRKLLYPFVYGSRPRSRFDRRVKLMLDRLGVWTLRR